MCGLSLCSPECNAEHYRCRSGQDDQDTCHQDDDFVRVARQRARRRWSGSTAADAGDGWLEASRRHDCIGRRSFSMLQHGTVWRRRLEGIVRAGECAGGGGRNVGLDLNVQKWLAKCLVPQPTD